MMSYFVDALAFISAALITYGMFLIYPPAAFITAGIILACIPVVNYWKNLRGS